MPIEILTISEWIGASRKDTVLENPAWPDIEKAIRDLNNENLNDLYLQPTREDPETYLCVGGGNGRYIVSGSIRNEEFPTVVDVAKSSDTREQLVVGGQGGDYPSSWIVDLDTALHAAKLFFELGSCGLENGLHLETSRLCLRLMKMSDVDELLCIFTDPKVMNSFGRIVFSREQMEGWVKRNLNHQNEYGYGLFSVILKCEGALIGDCGLERMELDGVETTELGYDFRSDYWNQGYATEAASAVRDYAFEELHLVELVSLIRVGNAASKRVAEKIGMQCDTEIERNGIVYWKFAMKRPDGARA